jgi:hypothetical protein
METKTTKPTAQVIHPTLKKVLWIKFVQFVAERPLGSIVKFVGLSFVAGLLSSLLASPDDFERVFYAVALWHNGLITLILMCFGFVFFAPRFFRFIMDELVYIVEGLTQQSCESDETIEGIPVTEMVDHLFEEKSFKREEIEGKFGIPRNRYQRLAEKMEDLDILTRGENNSRVLNEEMSRAEVIEHLKGKRVAMQLEYPLKIVRPPLPRSPVFVHRELAQTA